MIVHTDAITSVRVPGARDDDHARDVVDELLVLVGKSEDEHVLTEGIVKKAKEKNSALNPLIYRLNQREAAHEWYLDAARHLVRAIRVSYSEDDPTSTVPLLVHVDMPAMGDDDTEPFERYVAFAKVRNDKDAMRNIVSYRVSQVRSHLRYMQGLDNKRALASFIKQSLHVLNGVG